MTAVDTASPLRLDRYLALLAILMALVLGLLVIGERQQPAPSLPAIEGTLPPPAEVPSAGLAEQAALASRLEAAEQALRRTEAEIERLREENRALSERLEGEGAALDEIARRLAAVEAERDRLVGEVRTLSETRDRLEAQLAELGNRPSPPPESAATAPAPTTPSAPPSALPNRTTPPDAAAPSRPVAPPRDPSATISAQPSGPQAALEQLMREQRDDGDQPTEHTGDDPNDTGAEGGSATEADAAAEPVEPDRLITFNGSGGSVADGVEAYREGDFARAERIWGALAVSGDPRAQFHFGASMYEGRTGEPDLVMAYVWLSRAVDGGYLPAIELRRRVRAAMSEAQYQEALAIQTSS